MKNLQEHLRKKRPILRRVSGKRELHDTVAYLVNSFTPIQNWEASTLADRGNREFLNWMIDEFGADLVRKTRMKYPINPELLMRELDGQASELFHELRELKEWEL